MNTKYLKYAIGEIALVVIGILIALKINTISQERTNKKQIETILSSVFINLESDMTNTVLRYISFLEEKDSLNNLVLNQKPSFNDYLLNGSGTFGLNKLLESEFEPFQFERQAYERLIANIEIVPEEYMDIVEMLQEVYTKEAPVVNEVALEIKGFIDEIEDKYQTNYEWFSQADSAHIRQKIEYITTSPFYLNDVKRHQNLTRHLLGHLYSTKTNVSIAYSKIHKQVTFDLPFYDQIDRFYFPEPKKLEEYNGSFQAIQDATNILNFKAKDYYLAIDDGGVKFIKIEGDKFVPTLEPNKSYIEFERDEEGEVIGLNVSFNYNDNTIERSYKKIE